MKWAVSIAVVVGALFAAAYEWNHARAWRLRDAAEQVYYQGDFEGALERYDEVLRLHDDDPLSHTDAGDTISQYLSGAGQQLPLEEFDRFAARALGHYLRALDLAPRGAWSYVRLASLADSRYRRRAQDAGLDLARLSGDPSALAPEDRLEEAAWIQALRLEPNNFFYRDLLGGYYLRRGFRERALAHFRYSVQLHPILDRHFYLSDYAALSDEVVEALAQGAREALASEKTHSPPFKIHQSLAALYRKLERYDEALASVKASAEYAPTPHTIEVQVGLLHVRRGDDRAAVEAFRRATEMAPEYYRGWLQLALTLSRFGEHEDAVNAAYRAYGLEPSDYTTAVSLAQVLDAAGELEEAAETLEQLIRLYPDWPQSYTRAIDLYERAGRRAAAIDTARALAQRFPEEPAYRIQLQQLEASR